MPTRTQRLIVLGIDSHYGSMVARGVDHYCREHGRWEYHMEGGASAQVAEFAKIVIRHWKPTGIIAHIRSNEVETLVQKCGLPAVNVSGFYQPRIPSVISDPVACGAIAAQYFLDNGLRNFAFFAETPAIHHRQMADGFRRRLLERGIPESNISIVRTTIDHLASWEMIRRTDWLIGLKKPVAIACVFDSVAQGMIRTCQHLGLRVPDEVAILGAGNFETLCRMCTPSLSSIDLDGQRIGYEAARMLHRLLRGERVAAKPRLIPPRDIVVRQSSDIIAVEDSDVAAALRYIRDHAHESINVKDLLRAIPISRSTIDRRFEKLMGRTPREEIARIRLQRAKSLLEQPNLPLKIIVRESGFARRGTFFRFFREATGMTPMEFRKAADQEAR